MFRISNFPGRSKKREDDEGPTSDAVLSLTGGVMTGHPHSDGVEPSCSCKSSGSSLIGGSGAGWEGTALLHHGSYIKLGCLQFVFSITEFASKQPKEEQTAVPAVSCTGASTTTSTTATTPPPSTATVNSLSSRDVADTETPPFHQVPILHANSVP